MRGGLSAHISLAAIGAVLLAICHELEARTHYHHYYYASSGTRSGTHYRSSGGTPTYRVCVSAASEFKCNGKNYDGGVKLMEQDPLSDDFMGEGKANADGKFEVCGSARGDGSWSNNEEYEPYIKIVHNCCKGKDGKEIKDYVWKSDPKSLKPGAPGKKTIDGVDLSAADQCKSVKEDIKNGIKTAAKATGDGFKKAGKAIGDFFKGGDKKKEEKKEEPKKDEHKEEKKD